MSEPALLLTSVSVTFGSVAALRDVSLSVERGEICALVGLNGAGKSTLMRVALGMVRPGAGELRVHGRDVGSRVDWGRVGHMVGAPFAYPELTVAAMLRLAADASERAPSDLERVVEELDLENVLPRRIATLSSGNRQRVGIASALMGAPDLIVLDEPTNALDPAATISLRNALIARANAGAGILVSSHHLDEVARVAHRIMVIHHGRTVGELDVREPELERAFFARVAHVDGVIP